MFVTENPVSPLFGSFNSTTFNTMQNFIRGKQSCYWNSTTKYHQIIIFLGPMGGWGVELL